jgi:hypothetical protein
VLSKDVTALRFYVAQMGWVDFGIGAGPPRIAMNGISGMRHERTDRLGALAGGGTPYSNVKRRTGSLRRHALCRFVCRYPGRKGWAFGGRHRQWKMGEAKAYYL